MIYLNLPLILEGRGYFYDKVGKNIKFEVKWLLFNKNFPCFQILD